MSWKTQVDNIMSQGAAVRSALWARLCEYGTVENRVFVKSHDVTCYFSANKKSKRFDDGGFMPSHDFVIRGPSSVVTPEVGGVFKVQSRLYRVDEVRTHPDMPEFICGCTAL